MAHAVAHTGSRAASIAAAALRWTGTVVPAVQLLGDRVDVVVELAVPEHERRLSAGETAFTDVHALTRRLQEEPTFRSRSPVAVVGVLAGRARWPAARRVARGYGAFGPAAAVVRPSAVRRPFMAIEADCAGIGLVAVDGGHAHVLVPPPPWQMPTWTWVRRFGEEIIYAKMLALDLPH